MLKKIKSKTFKAIHTCIRTCLRENIILKRIPQSFITDIKIEPNKNTFEKTIEEIYKNFDINFNLDFESVKTEKQEHLEIFLKKKFSEVFQYYIDSKQFIRDKTDLIRKHNKNFGILYEYMSGFYLKYFRSSKGNNNKKRRTLNSKNSKNINFKVISSIAGNENVIDIKDLKETFSKLNENVCKSGFGSSSITKKISQKF